jgi:hypothetical protein
MHHTYNWIAQAILCLCIHRASCDRDALLRDKSRHELRPLPEDTNPVGLTSQVVFGDTMAETSSQAAASVLQFKSDFQLLGPFQIGTRGMGNST